MKNVENLENIKKKRRDINKCETYRRSHRYVYIYIYMNNKKKKPMEHIKTNYRSI